MNVPAMARASAIPAHESPGLLNLALILSFSCTGLDQILRTPPAQFPGAAEHWVTVSLMTLPLFAAAVWAGDWIAGRAGLGTTRGADIVRRALIISLLAAAALMPVWLELNKVDALARLQSLITPGGRGSVDVYWASSGLVTALLYVCLVPAAAWAGHAVAGRIRLAGGAGTAARAAVVVALLAAVPAAAWLLNHAARQAYASQAHYAGALPVRAQPHAFAARTAQDAPVTAAPFAFAYQAAHALQDGLVGQAAGFPVISLSLWLAARRASGRDQHQQPVIS